MSYRVHTQIYSGPFDLLLQLVSKQKLSISALSLSEVTDQYLAEVERMSDMDLDVASDFVLVASTLLAMKAQALVPEEELTRKRIDGDEDDDFDEFENLSPEEAREVLIARLIAYKQFRNVSMALAARAEAESRMFARVAGPDPDMLNLMPDYLEGISLRSLGVICADIFSQRETLLLESEHIAPKRLPVALTVASVDRIARNRGKLSFSELVGSKRERDVVVVTFLAVLELAKRGLITLEQDELFGDIELTHVDGAQAFEIDETTLHDLDALSLDEVELTDHDAQLLEDILAAHTDNE